MPPPDWRPLELVKAAAGWLAEKGVPSARLDAERILCETLGVRGRVELYARFERMLTEPEVERYRGLIRRRAAREPVSRIFARREFMGLTFRVTPAVLSPRPETEMLAEAAVNRLGIVREKRSDALFRRLDADENRETAAPFGGGDNISAADMEAMLSAYGEDAGDAENGGGEPAAAPPPKTAANRQPPIPASGPQAPKTSSSPPQPAKTALDLGSGSGCLAVSVAAMCPHVRVTATDISEDALAVASGNARDLGVAERIDFRRGDWFDPLADGERFDVILINPPYLVPGDAAIAPEVLGFDPPLALYGGGDGLGCYRILARGLKARLAPEGRAYVEVGAGQAGEVGELMRAGGLKVQEIVADLAGIPRMLVLA